MSTKLFAPSSRRTKPAKKSLEPYRAELFAHCYRMLGSPHDAEDVLQEVMTRAWASLSSFDGRSSLRTWLYRIATNQCLDELRRSRRRLRELPVGNGEPLGADDATPPAAEPARWIGPFPDGMLAANDEEEDPEAKYLSAESIRLAFIVALQRLSPQQRAVLILRDVMGWPARDVADALRTSVSAVNSSLHRARVVAGETASPRPPGATLSAKDRTLLERYVDAWVDGDADALAKLLAADATFSMPPNAAWLRGRDDVRRYVARVVFGRHRRARRFVWTRANGAPAFAVYTRDPNADGGFRAHAIQVLTLSRGRISDILSFHDAAVFPLFGLPPQIAAGARHR